MAGVFGQLLYLYHSSGTVVFCIVMVCLMVFEGVLHIIEVECAKRGYKGLVRKLYREFMIMGFISFAILLATETDSFNSSEWYESFHFAHVVILFIGITFLVQSGALVALIHFRKRTLLSHDNCTSEQLLVEYIDMHEDGGFTKWLFMNGPITISMPSLREKIEFKILQEFFIRSYNLPYEFQFATYMCRVLKDYVIALVEVRPISWMSLAVLIAINYLRIILIDPIFEADVCERFPADIQHGEPGGSSSSHRFLAAVYMLGGSTATTDGNSTVVDTSSDYGHHVCNEYTLRYTFFCEWLIFFYMLGVLIASEIYLSRLMGKVLDREQMIEWIEEEEEAQEEARKRATTIQFDDIRLEDDPDDPKDGVETQRPFQGLDHEVSMKFQRRALPPRPRTSTNASGESNKNEGAGITASTLALSQKLNSNGSTKVDPVTAMNDSMAQYLSPSERIATFRKEASKRRSNSYDTATGIGDGITGTSTKYTPLRDRSNSIRRSNSYDVSGGNVETNTNGSSLFKAISPTSFFAGPVPFRRENSAVSDSLGGAAAGSVAESAHPSHHSDHEEGHGHGQITTQGNRRQLYFRCLERIMHVEYAFHQQEATDIRRGSVTSVEEGRARHATVFTHDPTVHVKPSPNTPISETIARMRSSTFSANPAGGNGSIIMTPRGSVGNEPLSPSMGASMLGTGNAGGAGGDRSSVNMMSGLNTKQLKNLQEMIKQTKLQQQQQQQAVNTGDGENANSLYVNMSNSPTNTGSNSPSSFFKSNGFASKHSSLNLSSSLYGGRSSNSGNNSPTKGGSAPASSKTNPSIEDKSDKEHFSMVNPARVPTATTTLESAPRVAHGAHLSPEEVKREAATRRPSNTKPVHNLPIIDPQPEESTKAAPPPRLADTRQRGYSAQFFSMDEEEEIKAKQALAATEVVDNTTRESMLSRQSSIAAVKDYSNEKLKSCHSSMMIVANIGKAIGVRLFHSIMGYHIVHHHEYGMKPTEDIKELQKDFATIFLFNNAELYYYFVEMALLIQCLYIALWATNLIVIAMDSYHPILWEVALVVPLPLNFFILKSIIFTSCTLRSIVTLDQRIASQICEKAEDERNVNMRLRRILRTALRKMNVNRHEWHTFLQEKYDLAVKTSSDHMMNQYQFKMFLHSVQVFLTDESLKNLFTMLDSDCDGKLMWESLYPVVFPELQKRKIQIKKKRTHSHSHHGHHHSHDHTTTSRKSTKSARSSKAAIHDSTSGGDESGSAKTILKQSSASSKKKKTKKSKKVSVDGDSDLKTGSEQEGDDVEGEDGEEEEEGEEDGSCAGSEEVITFEYSLPDGTTRPPKKRTSVLHSIRDSIVGSTFMSMISGSTKTEHGTIVSGGAESRERDSLSSVSPSVSVVGSGSVVSGGGDSYRTMTPSGSLKSGTEYATNGDIEMKDTTSKTIQPTQQRPSLVGKLFPAAAEVHQDKNQDKSDANENSKNTKTPPKLRFAEDVQDVKKSGNEIHRPVSKQSMGSSNGSEGDRSFLSTSTMGSDEVRDVDEEGEEELDGEGVAGEDMDDFDSQESNYSEHSYVSDVEDDSEFGRSPRQQLDKDDDGEESLLGTHIQDTKKISGEVSPMSMNLSVSDSTTSSVVNRSGLYSPLSTTEESKDGQQVVIAALTAADNDDNDVIQAPRQVSYFTKNAKNFVDV